MRLLLAPVAAVLLLVGSFLLPSRPAALGSGGRHSRAPPTGAATESPSELVELEVRDVVPLEGDRVHAVILMSTDGEAVIPLLVGEEAAVSIAFRLARVEAPHPLAADLLDDVVSKLGGHVVEIRIDEVRDDVLLAHVVIRQGERTLELYARPSDSIALALSGNAKIYVTRGVMAQVGITRQEIEDLHRRGGPQPPPPSGEPRPGVSL